MSLPVEAGSSNPENPPQNVTLPTSERGGQRLLAIIGLGHIGPLGMYGKRPDGTMVTEFWDRLIAGENGVKVISHKLFPEHAKYNNINTRIGGYVEKTDGELNQLLKEFGVISDMSFKSRCAKLAEISAILAVSDAGLGKINQIKKGVRTVNKYGYDQNLAEQTAVIGGTGIGGAPDGIIGAYKELVEHAQDGQSIDPKWVFQALPGAIEEGISMDFGINGESYGVLGECATGGTTVGNVKRLVEAPDRRHSTGVGVNAESSFHEPVGLALFDALGANTKRMDVKVAPTASDETNDGFAHSEDATTVVFMELEEAIRREKPIYAVVTGFGATSDAYHASFPREDGKYQKKAMMYAMGEAGGIPKGETGYIRMHATGTKPPGGESADAIEARVTLEAIETILKNDGSSRNYEDVIAGASSHKPQTGHLLGGDGLTGVMIGCLAMMHGEMPGNWKTQQLLPDSQRLNMIVNGTRRAKIGWALINSFGFGGKNTSVFLRKPANFVTKLLGRPIPSWLERKAA